jgi:hypothetical protein
MEFIALVPYTLLHCHSHTPAPTCLSAWGVHAWTFSQNSDFWLAMPREKRRSQLVGDPNRSHFKSRAEITHGFVSFLGDQIGARFARKLRECSTEQTRRKYVHGYQ